jgi:hypothetical protein
MRLGFAVWEPVQRIDDGPRDTRWNALVLHTNGASGPVRDLHDWWLREPREGVGAHLQIASDGTVFQYLDTDRKSGHAWDANGWTIGCETEDNGHSSTDPWTPQQIASIVRVCRALDVPALMLHSYPSHGLGYHQLYDSWNQSGGTGHNCPGPRRVGQIPEILRQLRQGDEDDVSPEQFKAMLVNATGVADPAEALQAAEGLLDVARKREDPPNQDPRRRIWNFVRNQILAKLPP